MCLIWLLPIQKWWSTSTLALLTLTIVCDKCHFIYTIFHPKLHWLISQYSWLYCSINIRLQLFTNLWFLFLQPKNSSFWITIPKFLKLPQRAGKKYPHPRLSFMSESNFLSLMSVYFCKFPWSLKVVVCSIHIEIYRHVKKLGHPITWQFLKTCQFLTFKSLFTYYTIND